MSTIQTNTVDPALLATMNGTNNSTSSTTSSIQDAQNNFMTLLVTQMQNQDPLNPMDNAQVTSQMAQLSTVTGINQLNASVNALTSSFQTSQNLQAANMIGHTVLAPGNGINLSGGKAIYGVSLPMNADTVTVQVTNSSGQVVRTINAGALSQGNNNLSWDGKTDSGATAPDGSYTFSVTASSAGTNVATTSLEFGSVSSVSATSSGVKLNLANLGQVNMSDVIQIF